ncbi:DUF3888 domain-containing protein [Cytobacillus kochii]|uniref:DUF3888 domain-containing protein n=1 Tax=Cytobacillus kochii TaxID=859143 RepID=UPI00203DEB07|nr:DUF3888 domain-containing protein [Cytobacillus kochii]MCM3324023.1 DUF3888 domain-containing protein [Cytobacillus kochii]MCM3346573.1 DUF3888 domain-containing protein [Cytobacillus kochii]
MKKTVMILLLIFILFPNSILANEDSSIVSEALLTSLAPVLTEEIYQFYGYEKQYNLYDTEIKKLKRNRKGYHIIVKLEITTYEKEYLPPYGQDTLVLDLTPLGAEVITYKHKGDAEEKKVNHFYRKAAKDIEHSFKKRWRSYRQTRFNQFQFLASNNGWHDRLGPVTQLVKDINEEATSKYKNTIQPLIYFNQEEILILYKNKIGMNEMITLKHLGDGWVVDEREQKQGKKMTEQILSYM